MSQVNPEIQTTTTPQPAAAPAKKKRLSSGPFGGEGIPFGSNEMRLTGRQWVATLVIALAVLWALPKVWGLVEPVKVVPNMRVPFDLGNDYWRVERDFKAMMKNTDNAIVGDSVMWGAYVAPENTLSAQLNSRMPSANFANLGISGCHSVSCYGLIKYYGKAVTGKNVLVAFNPLWISTPREDLTTKSLSGINHSKLIPQLTESIPAYIDTGLDDRLGIAIKHRFEIFGWVQHMQTVCFGGDDIPAWTIKNPYGTPTLTEFPDLPPDKAPSLAKSWTARKIKQTEFPFVPLDKSYQWRYFGNLVELLQERGNNVYVLVGPYNEHMIKGKALDRYRQEIKPGMEKWLKDHKVPYLAPQPLPSDIYTDSSHPILGGYGLIADQLAADPQFQKIFK